MDENGKAAGINGIYPYMITHLGQDAIDWLAAATTNILDKGAYPQRWKHARVVAILKPGKPAKEVSSSSPVSKYLGVTIDRQLNYHKYLKGCANKKLHLEKARKNNMRRPTVCSRTTTFALCYSAAEYCASV
ncbi:Pol protein [Elysia marginata]|uniref:Pol protein n=1 Tax=Elysia marginata TaxID=1093978 RepID=A0AAV4H3N5_9GAST|nr:Pol protein [Elysia marginata]